MGVSGCGKSTIGAALARRLGWPFVDADDLHPQTNVDRMAKGLPLTDADRAPWLTAIREEMTEAGRDTVVACSALRHSYREVLRDGPGETRFVFLDVATDILSTRLRRRHGHFMPADLLDSQLETLEPPREDENSLRIVIGSARRGVAEVVDEIMTGLGYPKA